MWHRLLQVHVLLVCQWFQELQLALALARGRTALERTLPPQHELRHPLELCGAGCHTPLRFAVELVQQQEDRQEAPLLHQQRGWRKGQGLRVLTATRFPRCCPWHPQVARRSITTSGMNPRKQVTQTAW